MGQDKRPRQLKINDQLTITVLQWETFLKQLWQDEIIG
jgi:hypothetical protein